MEKTKHSLLFIADLDPRNGGAQKNTIKTAPYLSQYFDIHILVESLSENIEQYLESKGIDIIRGNIDLKNINRIVNEKGIEAIVTQWEYPKWLALTLDARKATGVKVLHMIHELPYVGTPSNRVVRNWEILTIFWFVKNLIMHLIKLLKTRENVLNGQTSLLPNFNSAKTLFAKGRESLSIYLKTLKSMKLADALILMGPASEYYVKHYSSLKGNLRLVDHNAAVDTTINLNEKLPNYKFDICFMARLEPGKGIFSVLKILHILKKDFSKTVSLIILGKFVDEDVEKRFQSICKRLNIQDNVTLAGFVPEIDKFEILRQSRIFLYPSNKDVFSISLAEALYAGCPAVVFKLPFTLNFNTRALHKVSLKINKMSLETKKLLSLSYADPEEFSQIRKEAHHYVVENFSWNKSAEDQKKILLDVLNSS